jgi:hypothetical protein
MKKIILSVFFTIYSFVGVAQIPTGVYGTIVNEAKAPISGMEVILMDSAKNMLANTTTDANGQYGFTINEKGNYNLVVMLNDSVSQSTIGVAIDNKALFYNFLFTQSNWKRDRNMNVITDKEMERMPVQNYQAMLQTKGNFDKDANGNMRSRTFGNGVKLIVDGQIMNDNSKIQFVPGSIGSMQVITR